MCHRHAEPADTRLQVEVHLPAFIADLGLEVGGSPEPLSRCCVPSYPFAISQTGIADLAINMPASILTQNIAESEVLNEVSQAFWVSMLAAG